MTYNGSSKFQAKQRILGLHGYII